jgi:hypothetical protein
MEEKNELPGTEDKAAVDAGVLRWLTGVPASDINFKTNLKAANEATIRAALDNIAGKPGQKTTETELRRRLKNILQERLDRATATNERLNRTKTLDMDTLLAEREAEQQRKTAQTEKERLIAQCYKAIGQVQTSNMFAKFAAVSSFVWLRDVKASKVYKDIPGVETWEKFCESVGMSRAKVDEDLANLAAFGEDFFTACQQLSVGYRDLRKLRQLTHDGSVVIEGECLRIGEEAIPINQEHADELQAAIEKVIEESSGLAKQVEKLKKGFDEAVKEETKSLDAEVKALVKEVKRLKPYDPEEKDRSFCAEQMEEIRNCTMQCIATISKFIVREDVQEDTVIMGQVEGHLQTLELCLADLRRQWEEKVQLFGE